MTEKTIGALALADEVLRWHRLKDLRGCDISPEDRRAIDAQFEAGFKFDEDYAPTLALALKEAVALLNECFPHLPTDQAMKVDAFLAAKEPGQ